MTLEETSLLRLYFVEGHWDLRPDLYKHIVVLNVRGSSRETES
jgi:hypothetical protein